MPRSSPRAKRVLRKRGSGSPRKKKSPTKKRRSSSSGRRAWRGTSRQGLYDYNKTEAQGFLRMIQKMLKSKLDREMYLNVYHYLIGDYEHKHHKSMFGTPDYYSQNGIGHFWENTLDRLRQRIQAPLTYNGIDFANNDGANFRDERDTALQMFRHYFPPKMQTTMSNGLYQS